MDYISGGDLKEKLDQYGSFDEYTARICAAQIILALEDLRKNNIVHRDLKPDNILIDANGILKLIDFGLSSEGFNSRQLYTDDKTGTLGYIAPEVLVGQPTTFSVDYWALGCMIYEFLFSIPPFNRDTEIDTQCATMKDDVVFEYEKDTERYVDAENLIKSLLNKDPEQRLGFKSIDEIKNHKWFASINWENVPHLNFEPCPVEADTKQKTVFNINSPQYRDILDDITEDSKKNGESILHSKSMTQLVLSDSEEEDDELSSFTQVSVENLASKTIRPSTSFTGVFPTFNSVKATTELNQRPNSAFIPPRAATPSMKKDDEY